jgi:hypothetical protein
MFFEMEDTINTYIALWFDRMKIIYIAPSTWRAQENIHRNLHDLLANWQNIAALTCVFCQFGLCTESHLCQP